MHPFLFIGWRSKKKIFPMIILQVIRINLRFKNQFIINAKLRQPNQTDNQQGREQIPFFLQNDL